MAEPLRENLRRRSPRAVFWIGWFVLSALSGIWAVANPIAAAPDEPTHITKAAALVREQTLGEQVGPYREFDLPWIFGLTHEMYPCHAFTSQVPASCWGIDYSGIDEVRRTYTSADNYNPGYYAVVGLPSVLPPSLHVLYLMRLAGVILGSGLIALGLRSIAEIPSRRWLVAGTAVAVVPMIIFMNSAVNPNGLEASAGIGLWLTLVAALRYPDPALVRRRWWRAGVLVLALANAKAFSPLYLGIIVVTVCALVPWATVRQVVTDRRAWPGTALGTIGAIAAVAWSVLATPPGGLDTVSLPALQNPWTALEAVLRRTNMYYQQLVANFGWHDSRPPDTVYSWISAAIGLLLILALAMASRRERVVLATISLSVVLIPVALQVPYAAYVGLPWQGRYLAAVAVGVPIIAGSVLDRAGLPLRLSRNVFLIALLMMAVVHVISFGANLRRYVAGSDADWFAPIPVPWNPPFPATFLMVAFTVAVAGYVWMLAWMAGGPSERDTATDSAADDATGPGHGAGSEHGGTAGATSGPAADVVGLPGVQTTARRRPPGDPA